MRDQVTQCPRRFGGIGVVRIHVDARGALAGIQSLLCKLARWIGLSAVNHLCTRISLMDRGDKGTQKLPVLFGIAPWIPIADVLLIPQSPVVDPIMKAVHHPRDITIEAGSLLRSG